MKFKRLFVQRFMGVGDEAVDYVFPDGGGITQVRARNFDTSDNGTTSNAGGKSTLIEAILFALTGKVLRNLSMEECLHRKAKGKGIVELEYDNIKVIRRIKPNGVELWVDGKELTHTASKTKTKELIDEHVGVNFETLTNILVFGQHNLFSFIDAKEEDKRQIVENLMNLAEYNLFEERAREKLRNKKADLKLLTDKHIISVSHIDGQKQMLAEQNTSLEQYRAKLRDELTALREQFKALPNPEFIREQWKNYEADVARRQQHEQAIIGMKEQRNVLSERLNVVLHEMRHEQNNRHPLVDKLHKIKEKFLKLDDMKRQAVIALDTIKDETVKNERERDQAEREYQDKLRAIQPAEDWQSMIRNLENMTAEAQKQRQNVIDKKLTDKDTCPTCYGVIDIANAESIIRKWDHEIEDQARFIESVKQRRAEDSKRMDAEKLAVQTEYANRKGELLAQKQALQARWEAETKKIDAEYDGAVEKLRTMKAAAEQAIKDFDQQLTDKYAASVGEIESKRNELTKTLEHLSKQLAEAAGPLQPLVPLEELGKIDAQRESLIKRGKEKQDAIDSNPYAEIIAKLEEGIKKMEADAEKMHADVRTLETDLPYYEFWADAMGKEGIKSFIIDQIVPSLNGQIDYWLQLLYRGSISLTFDKYLKVEMVNKASGNPMIFAQGSGSEQKRVDLAIMLAFRDIMKMSTGKDPSIIFFDECGESLDEDGIYHLYKTIEELSKTKHVFVVTHHPAFKSLLDGSKTITFEKRGGATKLAYVTKG